MAIIGFIVLGDRTSHGGVVISGDPIWTIDGQPVARIGDKVTCPRCKRVSSIVSSRFPAVTHFGQPMAYDQDMTDCGAVIFSHHNDHAGWGEKSNDETAAVPPVENYVPKQAPLFQEHFVLRNNETGAPKTGVPYTITTGEGNIFEGETDAEGRTGVVWTDSPLPVEVVTRPKPAEVDDPYHYAEPTDGEN